MKFDINVYSEIEVITNRERNLIDSPFFASIKYWKCEEQM